MRPFVACFALSMAATLASAAPPNADFYIAPNGNDRAPGTLERPFATVARAQEAVRELRSAQPDRQRPLVVMLRGGMYPLRKPLAFLPADSGTPQSPTVFAAYPGEKPMISGGVRITGWQKGADGRWTVSLPAVKRGDWSFMQLWVDGERRYRPRFPEDGYYRIDKPLPASSGVKDAAPDRFKYPQGSFDPKWTNLGEIEVLVFHAWTMDRLPVKSIDEARRAVTFTGPTLSNNWFFDLRGGRRFIIENARAAFTRPGTWFLDKAAGTLSYIPLPGEDMTKAEVIAPRLESLAELRGQANLGLCVENVIFRGLTFAHSNWNTPPNGYRCGQSESVLRGAITANGARNCTFDGCTITHIGIYGIELRNECQDNRIQNCEITDLGAGGAKIGDMGASNDANITSRNTVSNCLIAHCGRMHAAGAGVWIGASPYNNVEHNEVCDLYQIGISAGWSWGYGPSLTHHNRIAYNLIHDLGQGVTSDIGGTYTLGISPGTVIEHNVIHDVSSDEYGGRGIYDDEGSTDILIRDNIVYRTESGAFMHHYGRDETVVNNIWALANGGQLDRLREEPHQSFNFERNIVYYDEKGSLLFENWGNDHYTMDNNLYWDASGKPVNFAGATLEQWQKRGHDVHSLIADPLFVDPQHGDFRLKPNSPALKIGFKPIDTSTVGRQVPGAPKGEHPLAQRAYPPKPATWQANIDEDFEDLGVGDVVPGAVTSEENAQATIRVTDETAASGKHSLKLVDMPGQKYNYDPHLYFTPNRAEGVLHEHFDVRVDPGFQFYHEWRDITVFFRSGPIIRITPDGWLKATEKPLVQVPLSQWLGIDITCGVGKDANARWNLSVRLPGKAEPLEFKDLPCSPEFKALHWLLFGGEGEQNGVAYVDNVKVK
jgi:hypothetical protein